MAFYNHFTVIGSIIKVTFLNSSTNQPNYVMIQLNDDSSLTDVTAVGNMEQPYTTWKVCSTVGDNSRTVLWNRFSAKKFLGVSHPLSSQELRGNAGASPTEGAFFHIIAAGLPASSDGASLTALVEIWYTAVLTEPKDLSQS